MDRLYPLEGILFARKRLLLVPISLALTAASRGSVVTYSDQTFSQTNWILAVLQGGRGGTASALQQTKPSTTDTYRQVTAAPATPFSTGAEVYAFSIFNTSTSTYDPAHGGAISLVSFQEDRMTGSYQQEMGPAILQNGTYYYAFTAYLATGTNWQTVTQSPLRTDFKDITGTLSPDFSATAAPMRFGFVAINITSANGSSTPPVIGDYDNWSITITTTGTVPEPVAVLSVVTPAVFFLRRRRALTSGRSPV